MASKTPVVFFVFRRPDLTAIVFEAIRTYRPEKLILVADGARTSKAGEMELVTRTRQIVEQVDWPCEVFRNFANTNLGLRERILSGLDFAFQHVDRAIILEDDCLPSGDFFQFMDEMLEGFEEEDKVGLISGSNFAPYKSEFDLHFSRSPYIWGWATWRKTWIAFRESPQVESWSPVEFSSIEKTFSSKAQAKSFIQMMSEASLLNTWDISLAVWFRLEGMLAVVPRSNLVKNLGFGQDATHTKFEAFDVDVPVGQLTWPLSIPRVIEPDNSRERIMWRQKQLRWLWYPIRHPYDFTKRVFRYLANRNSA
jgi:hypothetical protein